MFTKIDIPNFGSYQNFVWDQSVKDDKGQPTEFKRLNIIYGRNYSGKTTLSRIFEAIQHQQMPENYDNPDFKVVLDCGTVITPLNLGACAHKIQVYNKHFVDDNLSFLRRTDGDIKAFATLVMGDENRRLQAEIDQIDIKLGSVGGTTGLHYQNAQMLAEIETGQKSVQKNQRDIDQSLTDFARAYIKGKYEYSADQSLIINYDRTKLLSDILSLQHANFQLHESESYLLGIIGQQTKQRIQKLSSDIIDIDPLKNHVIKILSQEIIQTAKIAELLQNANLSKWVESGVHLHQESTDKNCKFCSQPVPEQRWQALTCHFDESQKNLKNQLEKTLQDLKSKLELVKDNNLDVEKFSQDQQKEVKDLLDLSNLELNKLRKNILQITHHVRTRLENIFIPLTEVEISDFFYTDFQTAVQKINAIVDKHNESIASQNKEKEEAKNKLRLLKVKGFVDSSGYHQKVADLASDQQNLKDKKTDQTDLKRKIDQLSRDRDAKFAAMQDESAAADEINELLKHDFASNHLSLRPKTFNGRSGVTFEVLRDGYTAHNLSEGECSLIAFCYFLAKIKDNINDMIVYIDDPICSLDENHIFFIYASINSLIGRRDISLPAGKQIRYKQLFISTHNLTFLKYLRSIDKPAEKKHNERGFFEMMIQKNQSSSEIQNIPKYMKNYTTEFNYLFEKIYTCCTSNNLQNNQDLIYSFGNNARRFLEFILYFKFPSTTTENAKYDFERKLYIFFGENREAQLLCLRVVHEYSHNQDMPDRAFSITQSTDEICRLARYIVQKIEENDPVQLGHLLDSIQESLAAWHTIKGQPI